MSVILGLTEQIRFLQLQAQYATYATLVDVTSAVSDILLPSDGLILKQILKYVGVFLFFYIRLLQMVVGIVGYLLRTEDKKQTINILCI